MAGNIFTKRLVVALGARAAGKSALVQQYIFSSFPDEYYPTIEDKYQKTVHHDGIDYNCAFVDSSGHDLYSFLADRQAIGVHGYLLVYSIDSRDSFEMVQIIYDKIVDYVGPKPVVAVIVGQKADSSRRVVAKEAGQKLADKLGCAFVETSARDNVNVDKAFQLLMSEMEKRYPTKVPESPRTSECILA
ncbi:GTP-binding protein Rheb [Auricularia subglabra TFB-10046 SS5]|nr:GTP-binding protein Rheb [Auricularia subglabra TFB-10046 SS5]